MTRVLLAGTAAFALLTGCAHSPPSTAAQPPGHSSDMMANCPMNVPGTQVSAAEAVNGVTITFTAPEQVVELRRRVHAMASMHNEKHADGSSHGGMMGGGMMGGGMMSGGMMGGGKAMDGMKMPPSRATVVDLELGASVTVIPIHPDDLQKLRSAVRMHVQQMQENGCAMMEHGHGG